LDNSKRRYHLGELSDYDKLILENQDMKLWIGINWLIITLMMEELRTPETSVNFYQTTRFKIPEDSHLEE
jgi:hypothetical protein